MINCKLISFEPTPEMVEAAEDAYMPFGDMDLAIRMAILAAPAVQGEPSLGAWILYDATADRKYIKIHSDGSLAIFDSEAAARRAKFLHPGTDYKRCEYYTTPQPAEQQPELAKYQPCGCVVCTCEHETQCQGCGAHHCGTHPVGQLSKPAYQQPAPDVAELVEARELLLILRGVIGGATWTLDDEDKELAVRVEKAVTALAAYRKGAKP